MAVFKCKMCGGNLQPEEGRTTVECEYCGSMQTVGSADSEKKANLFNRANRLRMASEFDKAAGVYESIVAEYPEEAEAYWGLCLCAYGIEYVDDPGTGKKIPTCHRTLPESIMDSVNFDMACEYADGAAKQLYREEAKAIDRLQQDTLAIVAGEAPYDVFICYKETSESGSRTEDSVLGQEIYDALTAKGLKVFFARISLEDKLGRQYEPYIYAALHSSKVMLAIGTRFEHYDAVWVKNEWGRYLDMASRDKTKTLIPCYKGIDAYDIPREFRGLQAQDMSKLGWLQDLTRGVQKLCGKDAPTKPAAQPAAPAVAQQGSVTIDSLMKRVRLFLEDGNFRSAYEYLDKVLDIDAEYAPAYIARVLAYHELRQEADLGATTNVFEDHSDWEKALRFATPEQKQQYEGYLKGSIAAREEARKLQLYNKACYMLDAAFTVEEVQAAQQVFESIPGFKDADAKIGDCHAKIETILAAAYAKALKQLESAANETAATLAARCFMAIKDYRDSAAKAEEANQKAAEFVQAEREKQERQRREREAAEAAQAAAQKKKKKTTAIVIVILILIVAAVCAYIFVLQPAMTYSSAGKELAAGNYDAAAAIYTELGNYKDSPKMVKECHYQKATDLMNSGDYDAAIEVFNGISRYSNAAGMVQECHYRKATELLEAGDAAAAMDIFISIRDYKDSETIYQEYHYNEGTALLESGDADAAMDIFISIRDYKDSETIYQEYYYNEGTALLEAGQDNQALLALHRVGDYKDAKALVANLETRYSGRISAGCDHTVGLKADGTALAVGLGFHGRLKVSEWSDVIAIDTDTYQTVGLKADGTVLATGDNSDGQYDVSDWSDIVAVTTGFHHIVGLKADGTVLSVGSHYNSKCDVSDWADVVAIATGTNHTVGLKADGTVVAVGNNDHGECDVSDWTDIIAIAVGYWHTVGLKADGTVVAVGKNYYGQCDVSDWTDIIAIAAGDFYTVCLKADGTVVAVGENDDGQCNVSGWRDVVAITANNSHTVGLQADGTVVAVGDNAYLKCDVSNWDLW